MIRPIALFSLALAVCVCSAGTLPAAPFSLGTLYGTDAASGSLLTIDTTTGASTFVGSMGFASPSLAVDPVTGIMYAGTGGGGPLLYTVNPATGAATLVGDTGLGFAAIGGLEFRSDGTLFASVNILGNGGTGGDHLAILNTSTGAATVIGPYGTITSPGTLPANGTGAASIEGVEAIAFDPSGTLYAAVSARGASGTPGLYTVNTSTGAATFVASILDSSGSPLSGGIVSLQFLSNGTLLGGSAREIGGAGDGGRLVTINPTTGVFSFVGSVAASSSSLGGLAGISSTNPIPEPSSLALAVIGVGLLLVRRRRRRS